jgi:hypothetical protein
VDQFQVVQLIDDLASLCTSLVGRGVSARLLGKDLARFYLLLSLLLALLQCFLDDWVSHLGNYRGGALVGDK